MIFAILMIAAALAAAILVGFVVGGVWGGLLFVALLWGLYKMATYETGQSSGLDANSLNAFQAPLSDD